MTSLRTVYVATLALSAVIAGCPQPGTVGDFGGGTDPGGGGGGGSGSTRIDAGGAEALPPDARDECFVPGGTGQDCQVTADCDAPLQCVDHVCVSPVDPNLHCDEIEGILCPVAGQVCVAGLCYLKPASCTTSADCPNGFVCQGGTCVPGEGGAATCPAPGPGPRLDGSWQMHSILHLREGMPFLLDGLLTVSEVLAGVISGDADFGLPDWVEFIIGPVVKQIVDENIPPWAQTLILVLGDFSDVIDDMQVDSTVLLEGQPCGATYRGKSHWDLITVEYRDMVITAKPEEIWAVGPVEPEDFGATYSCGKLYIDKYRISNTLNGLIRWMLDELVSRYTGYPTVETALDAAIDCWQIASGLNDSCNCGIDLSTIVASACGAIKDDMINKIGEAIDKAAVELSVMTLKGVATIPDAYNMVDGKWYGSLISYDFPGEFTATRAP